MTTEKQPISIQIDDLFEEIRRLKNCQKYVHDLYWYMVVEPEDKSGVRCVHGDDLELKFVKITPGAWDKICDLFEKMDIEL